MTRLIFLALLLLGLGGCGETSDSAGIPTLVINSGTDRPTQGVASSTSVPTLVINNGSCGEIVLSGNPPRPADENTLRTAGNCLAGAFQACRATTLTIRDTTNNLTRQFSVLQSGAACSLRQALQTDPNSPPAIADCQRVRAYTTALVVEGCSHLGDFTLTP